MPVTKKATYHENIDEGSRHHDKELQCRPEVDALKVVLLDAAITKFDLRKCSL